MAWSIAYRLRTLVRDSTWVLPAAIIIALGSVAFWLPEVDQALDLDAGDYLDSNAAIQALASIGTGMITVTGLVFSFMLVALQFSNQAYSPRALSGFRRDNVVKVAFGVFTATFTYALLVVGDVGSVSEGYVPALSFYFALVLLLASVAMFLMLLNRLWRVLRLAEVLGTIGRAGRASIRQLHPDAFGEPDPEVGEGTVSRVVIHTGEPAVIRAVGIRPLIALGFRAGGRVELLRGVGEFVPTGAPLLRVVGEGRHAPDRALRRAVAFGDERTLDQDPLFAFRLLEDIAIKALSPAINDPTTAAQALDQIHDLLRRLAGRRLSRIAAFHGPRGNLRMTMPTADWDAYLHLALDEVRIYGHDSLQVHGRLTVMLEDLLSVAPPERRPSIEAQLELLGPPPTG
jgi:uncharacterized membrane protein